MGHTTIIIIIITTTTIQVILHGIELAAGTLPASFSTFQNLQYFIVPGNQLAGPLPASWGINVLATLIALDLSEKQAGH